jgi:hypothetical protein
MIVGDSSIDPRRVIGIDLSYHSGIWKLTAELLYGEVVRDAEVYFDTKDDALEALEKLDTASYKGPLADAIADKTVDDDDDDDEQGMGFV